MLSILAVVKIMLLFRITLMSADTPYAYHGQRVGEDQMPLEVPSREDSGIIPPPVKMTLHLTKTRYRLEPATVVRTRYVASDSTSMPEAVRSWYADQEDEACDRMACMSCETWYTCFETLEHW
jgi:hypothetical protein